MRRGIPVRIQKTTVGIRVGTDDLAGIVDAKFELSRHQNGREVPIGIEKISADGRTVGKRNEGAYNLPVIVDAGQERSALALSEARKIDRGVTSVDVQNP